MFLKVVLDVFDLNGLDTYLAEEGDVLVLFLPINRMSTSKHIERRGTL